MNGEKRPLGKLSKIADDIGFPVSYAYDDLVFLQNNVFLFQFDDRNVKHFNYYSNTELEFDKLDPLKIQLEEVSAMNSFTSNYCGKFLLEQLEESRSLQIKFLPVRNLG